MAEQSSCISSITLYFFSLALDLNDLLSDEPTDSQPRYDFSLRYSDSQLNFFPSNSVASSWPVSSTATDLPSSSIATSSPVTSCGSLPPSISRTTGCPVSSCVEGVGMGRLCRVSAGAVSVVPPEPCRCQRLRQSRYKQPTMTAMPSGTLNPVASATMVSFEGRVA